MTIAVAPLGLVVVRLHSVMRALQLHLRRPPLAERVQRTTIRIDCALDERDDLLRQERQRYIEAERRSFGHRP